MIMAFPTPCGRCGERKWRMKRRFNGAYLCAACDEVHDQEARQAEGARPCPVCEGELLEKQVAEEAFFIDKCSRCEGVWLDAGELDKIRDAVREHGSGYAAGLFLGMAIG